MESRFRAAAVQLQRAELAYRVGANEDPVLPGRKPAEDAGLHGFPAWETQIRFHAGEGVGGEARALFHRDAHLFVPVEIVGREGNEGPFGGKLGVERLSPARARRADWVGLAAQMR